MKKVKFVSLNETEESKTYSFISYLREDWVERSVVIKTDQHDIIKKIYITSNKFGTVEWINGFGLVNCKSWESPDAEPASALSKHYNIRLANGEMDMSYAFEQIIPDVLDFAIDMKFSSDLYSMLKKKNYDSPFDLEAYDMEDLSEENDDNNKTDDVTSDVEFIDKKNISERINNFIKKRQKIKEIINENEAINIIQKNDPRMKFEKFTTYLAAIVSVVIILASLIYIINESTIESVLKLSSKVLDLEESGKYFSEILDASEYSDFSIPPLVRMGKLEYPVLAKSMNVEATVLIRITIDENGNVLYVHVLEILLNKVLPSKLTRVIEMDFSDAALKAYNNSKYAPFYHKGKKTPVRFIISVVFDPLEDYYTQDNDSIKL